MATARNLSMTFVVAVLVASSCFAEFVNGSIPGKLLGTTVLKTAPGPGTVVLNTLMPGTVLEVLCRSQSTFVFDDPWWLNVIVTATREAGWVADYFVECQGAVGNCNISLC